MKKDNKIFVQYYDNLYKDKDYTAEIDQILNVWKNSRKRKPSSILDVGSGTGNHSFQFAKRGFQLTGMDIEKDMIDISNKKLKANPISKLKFIHADITKKKLSVPADLAFSFFFVINYITSLEYLVLFLKGVKKNLKKDGVYVFNSWNGNATCVDPPRIKQIDAKDGAISIKGTLNPRYDEKLNRSHFQYLLEIVDGKSSKKIDYQIFQYYWSPLVLKEAALMAGFKDVKIFKHLTLNENYSKNDYVLDFACYA